MKYDESITSPEVEPVLSVILPTDSYATIQPVLERLRRQTIAPRIEVVLVGPHASLAVPPTYQEFAQVRVVEVAFPFSLGAARATGIRAATAPFVFIGETHSYFYPDAAEKLVAVAEAESWTAVAPGFENGNPKSVSSWSCFLADYGRWSARLPGGEIEDAPLYNAVYRRDALVELNGDLAQLLSHGDQMRLTLQAHGHRTFFEPAARIDHVNLDRLSVALHEQFLAGTLIGRQRAARWPWWRRLVYIFGAGLIPLVLVRRVWPGIRRTARTERLPIMTAPLIVLLMFAKAAGELIGYAGMATSNHQAAMEHYEIHKVEYLGSKPG
ncbi:MAG TPA: glycosyltransferase [Chthoniobacterales bacterium]|nr:glycosyltransferase [Chthoniobacterales bacterium]